MKGGVYWVENSIVVPHTSRIYRIDPIMHKLKHCKIRVGPWLLGVKDIPDNRADERIAEVRADVRREILDTWENLLPVDNLWKLVNRAGILHLDSYYQ